jgi:hypothetical protein
MTDAFKGGKAVNPKSVNKPVPLNRSSGYRMGTRVDASERTQGGNKTGSTRGKSQRKANGTRMGVMLPPSSSRNGSR